MAIQKSDTFQYFLLLSWNQALLSLSPPKPLSPLRIFSRCDDDMEFEGMDWKDQKLPCWELAWIWHGHCPLKNYQKWSLNKLSLFLFPTVRPEFTIRPANTSALLGGEVSLSCVARGDPPPEITWRKEGGQLPFKRVHFDEERFLLSNVSESDTGVYTCVAENKAGSINSSAIVNVLRKCEICVQQLQQTPFYVLTIKPPFSSAPPNNDPKRCRSSAQLYSILWMWSYWWPSTHPFLDKGGWPQSCISRKQAGQDSSNSTGNVAGKIGWKLKRKFFWFI